MIFDNAFCHTGSVFRPSLERWAERGLLTYHLSPYSSELNSIERFWRKLKYEPMPAEARERFTTLLQTLTTKPCAIGEVSGMPSTQSYAAQFMHTCLWQRLTRQCLAGRPRLEPTTVASWLIDQFSDIEANGFGGRYS
ncbi:transposase [Roseimaritima sediminicola]|uniref:transposase n=1 Tax=Roseimaritima sediminicola TaxID=2662066 RepID=UPI001386D0CD